MLFPDEVEVSIADLLNPTRSDVVVRFKRPAYRERYILSLPDLRGIRRTH